MKAAERAGIELMGWIACERQFIRRVEIDWERISSMEKKAMQRLERAKTAGGSPSQVSFIVEDYYEVMKGLLIAYALSFGIRSKNHQCLISFFYRENPDFETEARLIARMSFYRNRLEYYGEDTPLSFYEANKESFEGIIRLLRDLLRGRKSPKEKNN